MDNKPVIVGKRVQLGAIIGSIAAIFAHIWPEHAPAIIAAVVPITAITQVIWVNTMGITIE